MDLLLVDPPYCSLKGVPTDVGYNVGLTSLAAYTRQHGIETGVIMGDLLMDLPSSNGWFMNVKKYAAGQRKYEMALNDKSHVVWKKLADYVNQTRPAVVGISYLTPLKGVVERIAELIREVNGDIKVVVGSHHPTFCYEEVMRNPHIDFVVRGEGEVPLLRLVQEIKKDRPRWETVPGICYRDEDGRVQSTPGVGLFSNLDELPFLARDLVLNCDYKRYRGHSIYSARGCPYTCSFCSDRSLWGGKVRRRSVDNVLAELRLIKETYNPDFIDFVDGTFTYDRRYLQAFCKALIDSKLDIKWRCTARYDNLDEELLQLMKRANCSGLYFGMESGSDRVLKSMDKKITVEQMLKVGRMVRKSGILTATAILLGLPDEGKDDIEETLRLMKVVKTDIFDVNSYVPLPGTPLYDSMSEGDRANIDWRKAGYKSFDSYFSRSISQEDFKRYMLEAYTIAGNAKKRAVLRLGGKMLLDRISRPFKKLSR